MPDAGRGQRRRETVAPHSSAVPPLPIDNCPQDSNCPNVLWGSRAVEVRTCRRLEAEVHRTASAGSIGECYHAVGFAEPAATPQVPDENRGDGCDIARTGGI